MNESAVSSKAWAGYSAFAWSMLFGAMSFYWAAGGMIGADTIGESITALAVARDPGFVAILWGTGLLKVLAGLLPLALVRQVGGKLLQRLVLIGSWVVGDFYVLYGGANLIQHGLMVAGAIAIPEGLGVVAAYWHLLLWDPFWLLGGVLFIVAAWRNS